MRPHPSATDPAFSARVALMLELAERAGTVALRHFQCAKLSIETKPDASPVTEADLEIEAMIRTQIRAGFAADAMLGEEMGEERGEESGTTGFRWIIDPIDGTVSFAHGVPLFGLLLAIEYNGTIHAGICAFPALRERIWAVRGEGTWWERVDAEGVPHRTAARVRPCARLADALVCSTGLEYFDRTQTTETLVAVARTARRIRGWSDCYGLALVATGRADAAFEPLMKPWDCGPFPVIFAEAGGIFTDWRGSETIMGGNAVACHRDLHAELLRVLQPSASHEASKANA
jgi:histidinol phosphatase-like enzyme (inositol monophosphatase family)